MNSESDKATKKHKWGKASGDHAEKKFLEGPQPRRFEFFRALGIFYEFLRGFRAFTFLNPCVTVFGSARFDENNKYYEIARELGRRLGSEGFSVMTGGGPGIMEAANRGAREVGAYSVGCNIILPKEQNPNPYLDQWVEFNNFFVRKVMLVKYSYAFVALPGGFGTLDEIFETLTLIQTGKISNFPLILMGKEYWEPLLTFFNSRLVAYNTVDRADLDRIVVTDSVDDAMEQIRRYAFGPGGLKYGKKLRRFWLFGE